MLGWTETEVGKETAPGDSGSGGGNTASASIQSRNAQSTNKIRLTILGNGTKKQLLSGAEVKSGGKTYQSDENGNVSIPKISTGSIEIQKEGYVPRKLTAEQIGEPEQSKEIVLQKTSGDVPVISAVWVNGLIDVLNEEYPLSMVSGETTQLKAEVDWGKSSYGSIRLVQEERTAAFLQDTYSGVISSRFDTSGSIYILAMDKEGRSTKKKLNFENSTENGMMPKALSALDGASVDFGKGLSFPLPDSVPDFLKDTKISAGVMDLVPVTISANNGKIKIAIGVDLVSYSKKEKYYTSAGDGNKHTPNVDAKYTTLKKEKTETAVDEFMDCVKKIKNIKGDLNKSLDARKKLSEIKKKYDGYLKYKPGKFGVDASVTVVGFAEGTYDEKGKITLLDSGIIVNPSVSVEKSFPHVLPVGPILVPTYFKASFNADVKGQYNIRFQEASKNFIPNGEISGSLSLTGAAGAGISGVAYVEGGLTGELGVDWKIMADASDYFKLDAALKAYIEAGIAVFKAKKEWNLASANLIEYPDLTTQPHMLDSAFIMEGANDPEEEFQLKDLGYLDSGSEFTANETARILNSGTVIDAENPVKAASGVFKENIYKEADPQLVSLGGGTKLAVWLDSGSEDVNEVCLYYSYYDGTAWSDPMQVENDGTMDNSPTLTVLGNKAYLAWQDATKAFDLTEESTLSDIVGDFDISIAEFDGNNGFTVSSIPNDGLDMMPCLCKDGTKNYVVWLGNEENSWFGNNGKNTIYYSEFSNTSVSDPKAAYQDLNSINALTADGGTGLNIAYSMDTDGDLSTVGDVRVFENGQRISEGEVEETSPSYLGHELYCYRDGRITDRAGTITGGAIASDDYRLLEISGKKAVIFREADGLYSTLKVSCLDEESHSWGETVALSDGKTHIGKFSVTEDDNGRFMVMVLAPT